MSEFLKSFGIAVVIFTLLIVATITVVYFVWWLGSIFGAGTVAMTLLGALGLAFTFLTVHATRLERKEFGR